MKIPDTVIKDIAENLEIGLCSYINKETGEIISIPVDIDIDFIGEEDELWRKDLQTIRKHPKKIIKLTDIPPRYSFEIMDDFISTITNNQLKYRLKESIQKSKPFRHFKSEINRADKERDRWFEFKKQRVIEWITARLEEI